MLVGILVPSDGTRQKAFSEGMERSSIGITNGDLLGRIKGPIGQVCFSGQEEDHIVRPVMAMEEVTTYLSRDA